METGIELIAKERQRQIDQEGWTPAHDDEHEFDELALAAAAYALPASHKNSEPYLWPWDYKYYKSPNDRVRELVKAGALIAAEIDRLNRIKK